MHFFSATHQGFELAFDIVIHKEFFRQHRLVVEHVDQKAQSAEVVAQLVKSARSSRTLFVNFCLQHLLHAAAHAQDGLRGLIQPEHRQHAAHLGQLPRNIGQDGFVFRIAKENIQRFFKLTQRQPKFAHHATHGLLVADAAVKLFHPGFKGLGTSTVLDAIQTLSQMSGALSQLRVIRIEVIKCSLQVQHRGGKLHGKFNRRRLSRSHRHVDRASQGLRQRLTAWMQLDQRITDEAELIGDRLEFVGVPCRDGGPCFFCRGNPFARLRQQGRVKAAKLYRRVVDWLEARQAIHLAHSSQHRGLNGRLRNGLRTKEKKVMRQPVRNANVAFAQAGVLKQHSGRGTSYVNIRGQQVKRKRFKVGRSNLPENAWLAVCVPGRKCQT